MFNINNVANPDLISYDTFVFCSIPRLFICLRMRIFSSLYANIYVESIFICLGSIAGVPFDSVRLFRASLLLYTTCAHLYCNRFATCVAVHQTKIQKTLRKYLRARRFRATLLLYTTCVRSCCTWRASCVAAKQQNEKNCGPPFMPFPHFDEKKLYALGGQHFSGNHPHPTNL